MSTYKIKQVMNYNDVELEVEVCEIEGTEEVVDEIGANMHCLIKLHPHFLEIAVGEKTTYIQSDEKDKYQFLVCKKQTIPISIDELSKMTNKEKLSLLENESYMLIEDDFEEVNWDIKQAYNALSEMYSIKEFYSFDSLAYSIEKI